VVVLIELVVKFLEFIPALPHGFLKSPQAVEHLEAEILARCLPRITKPSHLSPLEGLPCLFRARLEAHHEEGTH
jgi:hypothetical protein